MTRSASISRLGSEFDDFLFAPIGEDRNGMLLSVLSALARLDIEPWQEAAKLARLPRATATERLASLIAALPDEPSRHRAPSIAACLIALLPSGASANTASRKILPGAGALTISPAAMCVISCLIVIAVMLSAQYILASRQPPSRVSDAHASASGTISPEMPPPGSGQ